MRDRFRSCGSWWFSTRAKPGPAQSPDLGFPIHCSGHLHNYLSLRLSYTFAVVMVVPSQQEAFGQTASEAQACGTPVVAFLTGGPGRALRSRLPGRGDWLGSGPHRWDVQRRCNARPWSDGPDHQGIHHFLAFSFAYLAAIHRSSPSLMSLKSNSDKTLLSVVPTEFTANI